MKFISIVKSLRAKAKFNDSCYCFYTFYYGYEEDLHIICIIQIIIKVRIIKHITEYGKNNISSFSLLYNVHSCILNHMKKREKET